MLDIIIQGGEVVTPQGVIRCDVAIAGETIAALAAPGALPAQSAGRVIDANGCIVMPGGIDPHVHLHHVWIKPDGTPLTTAGPEQVGRAAHETRIVGNFEREACLRKPVTIGRHRRR